MTGIAWIFMGVARDYNYRSCSFGDEKNRKKQLKITSRRKTINLWTIMTYIKIIYI